MRQEFLTTLFFIAAGKPICRILFAIFCFLFSFNQVSAIGIGASPSSLDLELKLGQPKEVKILVYNISKEAGIFKVFPDELNDWIKITPDNFRLEAGENREIKIEIIAKENGRKATNLSVSATPLDRASFSLSPGLKIPLKLSIEDKKEFFSASISEALKQNAFFLTIIIFIICLAGFFLIKYIKKRKNFKIIPPPENLPVEEL